MVFFDSEFEMIPFSKRIFSFKLLPLIYLEGCLEFIDHLTFFLRAYSGRKSESCEIDEWRRQYGLNLLVVSRALNIYFSVSSDITFVSISLWILDRSCFIIVQSALGLMGAPSSLLPKLLGILLYPNPHDQITKTCI